MARFDKLEFENPEESRRFEEQSVQPVREEVTWLKRAEDSRRMGLYESALQYYSRALEEDKTLASCWVGQVQMLIHLEEYPEAELWSQKALELFPSHGELLAARAQALCRQKKTREAYAAIDQAMQQPGQSANRWMVRGELLIASRQKTEMHCFDKALHNDEDWLVPVEIALIYQHYGQNNKAMSRARLAIEREPSAPYAWYVLARCQVNLGMPSGARRSLQNCLELKPDYRDAQNLLATAEAGGSFWQKIKGFWSN